MEKQSVHRIEHGIAYLRIILMGLFVVLLFTPMFGGSLLIFQGTFIYFSYFLATFVVGIIGILDLYTIAALRKITDQIKLRQEITIFLIGSILIMIGLLQGRYVGISLLGVSYILLALLQLYWLVLDEAKASTLSQITYVDLLQHLVFYLGTVVLLLGNQPFESWNIPLASASLIFLILLSIGNMFLKLRNIK